MAVPLIVVIVFTIFAIEIGVGNSTWALNLGAAKMESMP